MRLMLATAALAAAIPTVAAREAPQSPGVGLICGAETAPRPAGAIELVRVEGMGTGGTDADTANPEAKTWFDYGLKLYHAFNHEEAKQAFAKAAALDPACAACAWGVALGLGPTLNYGITPQQTADALLAADKAAKLVKPGDERMRMLTAALQARYRPEGEAGKREVAYGQAMDAVARRFPADPEVAVLAAHALLTPARAGNDDGVPRAEELLEGVLARRPNDTAAIHYYIHATEFAGHAGEALEGADKLARLAPSASHLVHMGAHTMMRVGHYQDVAVTNAAALKVDAVQRSRGYAASAVSGRYYAHNFQFGLAGAMMSGDRALALKYAEHGARVYPAGKIEERLLYAQARSLIPLGRYAPDRALAVAETPDDSRVRKIFRHYARGEAYAARRDADGMAREAAALDRLRAEAVKAGEAGNDSLAVIALNVVQGRAAMIAGRYEEAAARFATAAARQKTAFPVFDNFDPPPWWYPVRRSLAAAQFKAGNYVTAAREARQSLAEWPNDALALRVLAEAEMKLGRPRAAAAQAAEAASAWRGRLADTPIELT